MSDKENLQFAPEFARTVDFGRTAQDYGRFRAGFPDLFFQRLAGDLGLGPGMTALDVGTGAGTVARGLARRGLDVTAVDPSPDLMGVAAELDREAGVTVRYRIGKAEALPIDDASQDLVVAGQCWHWFDRSRAAAEACRVLRPGGRLVIAHFDWLPLPGNVVEATERLIVEANPAWAVAAGGAGIHPRWLADMAGGGFEGIVTASFDVDQPYSHEGWRGRIRASAGVKATLDAEATAAFDTRLQAMLDADFPVEPVLTPHRVWWAVGTRGG